MGRIRIGSSARQLLLVVFCTGALLPVYFMVANSFKTNSEYLVNPYGLPHTPVLSTIISAFRGGELGRWLVNSVIFTGSSVVISTTIAALAAYAIALMRWRPGQWVLSVLIALMVLPPIVLVIPLFRLMADLGQLNTYRGVIAIYAGLMLPFSTFLLASFFQSVPRDIIDAARLDGASHLKILRLIVLPTSLPALVTVCIVQAIWVWNEVLIAVVFLQSEQLRTLMVGVTIFRSRYHLDVPIVMAGMLWATVPIVLLYVFGQRFFIRGLSAGAVKG